MDVGAWLVERRGELDRGEAGWLERLAEFDRDGLWAAEGQLSCVSWLVWRTNMGRSTAFDKLRVAHQLARRPIVAEALAGAGCRIPRCGLSPVWIVPTRGWTRRWWRWPRAGRPAFWI